MKFRKPVSEETKKKISEALTKNKKKESPKERRAGRLKKQADREDRIKQRGEDRTAKKLGRKGSDLKNEIKVRKARKGRLTDKLKKSRDEFKAAVAPLKAEIEKLKSLPKGERKKKVKALRAEIKALREERKTRDAGKKAGNKKQRDVLKRLRSAFKSRKRDLSAKLKQIRSDAKAGLIPLKEAKAQISDDIKKNTNVAKSLRAKMKGLSKNSPLRKAIQGQIDGLKSDNADLRAAKKDLTAESKNIRAKKKADVDAEKKAFNEMIVKMGGIERPDNCHKEFKEVRPFRKERPSEVPVDFKKFQEFFDKAEEDFGEKTKKQLDEMINKMMKRADTMLRGGKISDIAKLSLAGLVAYKATLKDGYKKAYDFGKISAADEIGVDAPKTTNQQVAKMNVTVGATVDQQAANIELATKAALIDGINRSLSHKDTLFNAKIAAVSKAEKMNRANMNIAVIGQVTQARQDIFLRHTDIIQKFQYSAILDGRTTNWCSSLDGRTVTDDSPEFETYRPGQHFGCRSIWVAIGVEEVVSPKAEPIQPAIPSQQGGPGDFKDLPRLKNYTPVPEKTVSANEKKADEVFEKIMGSLSQMLDE